MVPVVVRQDDEIDVGIAGLYTGKIAYWPHRGVQVEAFAHLHVTEEKPSPTGVVHGPLRATLWWVMASMVLSTRSGSSLRSSSPPTSISTNTSKKLVEGNVLGGVIAPDEGGRPKLRPALTLIGPRVPSPTMFMATISAVAPSSLWPPTIDPVAW